MNPEVKFKRLFDKAQNINEEYKSFIYSISSAERCYVAPGERKKIKTFLEINIPSGFFGLIQPRKDEYLRIGLNVFPEVLYPEDKKELQLVVTNVNIPKSPFFMSDKERFLGDKSKIDIYIGDKICNFIILPITEFNVKEVL
jgi:dUTPase